MTRNVGSLTVRSIILCDDVRREVNGRCSFMGVYTGAHLIFSDPPVLMKMGVGVVFIPGTLGDVSLEVQMAGDALERPLVVRGELTVEHSPGDLEYHTLSPGTVWLEVKKSGSLIVSCRQNGGQWHPEREYRLKFRPDSPKANMPY